MKAFSDVGEVLPKDETPHNAHAEESAATASWHVGPRSARVVFDLGDGELTSGEVTWAIQTVRRARVKFLPSLPEADVLGAAYYNAEREDCFIYPHADHHAVHVALYDTDQGTPGAQFAATCASDPAMAAAGRTAKINDELYREVMAPVVPVPSARPNLMRSGDFQRIYGWLSSYEGGYWPADFDGDGARKNEVLFGQWNAFWKRY